MFGGGDVGSTDAALIRGVVEFVGTADADGGDAADAGVGLPGLPDGQNQPEPAHASVGGWMNEYEENHLLMSGSFPELFPLGIPDSLRKGHLPLPLMRRLLLNDHQAWGRCPRFLFVCYNQWLRCQNAVSSADRAKAGCLEKLKLFLEEPGIDDVLKEASRDCNSDAGKRVLQEVVPLLHAAGRCVAWSTLERQGALSRMYALAQRYGPHSYFITFTQSSARVPLVIRICAGCTFRAAAGQSPMLETAKDAWESTTKERRVELAIDNPAVCAWNFNLVCMSVLEVLLGCPLAGGRLGHKTEKHLHERKG